MHQDRGPQPGKRVTEEVFAFFDSGSHTTYNERELTDRFQLPIKEHEVIDVDTFASKGIKTKTPVTHRSLGVRFPNGTQALDLWATSDLLLSASKTHLSCAITNAPLSPAQTDRWCSLDATNSTSSQNAMTNEFYQAASAWSAHGYVQF